jgi:transposase, IS5 family
VSLPRDDRQDDLFRASVAAIINLRHPLVRLAAEINWDFLAKRFSSCRVGPGQPPLELPFDHSSLTRWRQRLGEEQIAALLQESLSVAHRSGAIAADSPTVRHGPDT